MRHGFEVSDPGQHVITGYDVCGFYLGGRTPHAWSAQQVDVQPERWRAPFWLADPNRPADSQGADIAAALEALHAPPGSIYFLDMETLIAPTLVNDIAGVTHAAGYRCGVYGSESTVFGNPPRAGYFVARYDGIAALYEHPHALAKQYSDHGDFQGVTLTLSVYADACPLWDTRPQPVTLSHWAQTAISDCSNAATLALSARSLIAANAR